ncbi:ATP-binding protein [Sinomonas atrocyanea]
MEGPARPELIDAVHERLDSLRAAVPGIGAMDAMAFELAVIEVVTNSIEHARAADATVPVYLAVELESADGELRARIFEHGTSSAEVPGAPAGMPHLHAESGRGLALLERLLSSVAFERIPDGGVWTLVLKTAQADGPS